jgi:hypothetical protein
VYEGVGGSSEDAGASELAGRGVVVFSEFLLSDVTGSEVEILSWPETLVDVKARHGMRNSGVSLVQLVVVEWKVLKLESREV